MIQMVNYLIVYREKHVFRVASQPRPRGGLSFKKEVLKEDGQSPFFYSLFFLSEHTISSWTPSIDRKVSKNVTRAYIYINM